MVSRSVAWWGLGQFGKPCPATREPDNIGLGPFSVVFKMQNCKIPKTTKMTTKILHRAPSVQGSSQQTAQTRPETRFLGLVPTSGFGESRSGPSQLWPKKKRWKPELGRTRKPNLAGPGQGSSPMTSRLPPLAKDLCVKFGRTTFFFVPDPDTKEKRWPRLRTLQKQAKFGKGQISVSREILQSCNRATTEKGLNRIRIDMSTTFWHAHDFLVFPERAETANKPTCLSQSPPHQTTQTLF